MQAKPAGFRIYRCTTHSYAQHRHKLTYADDIVMTSETLQHLKLVGDKGDNYCWTRWSIVAAQPPSRSLVNAILGGKFTDGPEDDCRRLNPVFVPSAKAYEPLPIRCPLKSGLGFLERWARRPQIEGLAIPALQSNREFGYPCTPIEYRQLCNNGTRSKYALRSSQRVCKFL